MRHRVIGAVVAGFVLALATGAAAEEAAGRSVIGSLSKEAIAEVVRGNAHEVRYCYERSLQNRPTLRGTVRVLFVIGSEGRVTTAEVKESSLDDDAVEACLVSRVKQWRFPKPRGGGSVQVTYPWLFKPNTPASQASRRRILVPAPPPAASPDRPRYTLTARTTREGAFEVELGGDLDGAELGLQYGLGSGAELMVGIGWDLESGVARPVAAGFRWRLMESAGLRPALAAHGQGRLVLGDLGWESGFLAAAIASWGIRGSPFLDLNAGVDSSPDGGLRPWAAAALRFPIVTGVQAFAEAERAWIGDGAADTRMGAGVGWAVTRRFVLDAAVHRDSAAGTWSAGAGVTWLLVD